MEKLVCKLVGKDGNIYNLMMIASKTLRAHELYEQSEELIQRIIGGEARSYDEALRIIMEYVEAE